MIFKYLEMTKMLSTFNFLTSWSEDDDNKKESNLNIKAKLWSSKDNIFISKKNEKNWKGNKMSQTYRDISTKI